MSRCRSMREKLVLLAAGELEGPEQEQTARLPDKWLSRAYETLKERVGAKP